MFFIVKYLESPRHTLLKKSSPIKSHSPFIIKEVDLHEHEADEDADLIKQVRQASNKDEDHIDRIRKELAPENESMENLSEIMKNVVDIAKSSVDKQGDLPVKNESREKFNDLIKNVVDMLGTSINTDGSLDSDKKLFEGIFKTNNKLNERIDAEKSDVIQHGGKVSQESEKDAKFLIETLKNLQNNL